MRVEAQSESERLARHMGLQPPLHAHVYVHVHVHMHAHMHAHVHVVAACLNGVGLQPPLRMVAASST